MGGASTNGVVFKLSPGGTYTVLYSFAFGLAGSSVFPNGPLIADSSGNLYGTTYYGGASGCNGGFGCGVVFKLSPGGTYTVLHTFTGSDGRGPSSGLIADSSGNLYGTTAGGEEPSRGVVFKLPARGSSRRYPSVVSSPSSRFSLAAFQPRMPSDLGHGRH